MEHSLYAPLRDPKNRAARQWAAGAIVLWLISAFSLLVQPWLPQSIFFVYIFGTAVCFVFAVHMKALVYTMAVFYPFIHLMIIAGSINAPVIDFLGVIAVASQAIRIFVLRTAHGKPLKAYHWWGAGIYLAWIITGIISASQSITVPTLTGLYYALRFMAFFYPAFVWVVMNTVHKRKFLQHIFYIFYAQGILISIYGLYGLVLGFLNPQLPTRVNPLPIAGIAPLGVNHNLIADLMVTTIPIGLYLLYKDNNSLRQKFLFMGILLMAGTNLLTFSRTGWLALLLEIGILVLFQYRHHLKNVFRYGVLLFVVMLPLVLYMAYFSFRGSIVASSNESRLFLNDVALEMFQENPLVGDGPNAFIYRLSLNEFYLSEFGDPIDAHGFIQKVGSEVGGIGLVLYCALLLYALLTVYQVYRRQEDESDRYLMLSMVLLVAGSSFSQLFQTSYYSAKLWFPLGVALAAAYIIDRKRHA